VNDRSAEIVEEHITKIDRTRQAECRKLIEECERPPGLEHRHAGAERFGHCANGLYGPPAPEDRVRERIIAREIALDTN
jgi:hypothetical protein